MSDELQNNEENWEQKAGEYLAGWKRAQADYANLQKELSAQKAEMGRYAISESVRSFLPVYDYFKRAMQQAPATTDLPSHVAQWMTGVSHIANLFKMTLDQLGVEEIPTQGKSFDPNTMDALKEEYREGVVAGTVIEEVEGGYRMGDKIIKPARVIVAAPEAKSTTEQETNN